MSNYTTDQAKFSRAWNDHIGQLTSLLWSLEKQADRDRVMSHIEDLKALVEKAADSLEEDQYSVTVECGDSVEMLQVSAEGAMQAREKGRIKFYKMNPQMEITSISVTKL